ncbi:hypothetical protein ACFYW6_22655 [Streptomyces sp. NPDC002659]|uniref:hypothetical protein n=1 Tax=Streptomyces sp. NPDC002659 TaxID=3364656 RepID=UPI003677D50A
MAGNVEGVGDLLEDRELLHSALAVHVVVEPPLRDVHRCRDAAGADAAVVEQPEQGPHVALRARGKQAWITEQPGDDLA